jgi:hypothetical protein
MKFALTLSLVLAVATGVFWLVWMNRASEKVLTTVITISIGGVVSIVLSTYFFSSVPQVRSAFPVCMSYQLDGSSIWVRPPHLSAGHHAGFSFGLLRELQKQKPELFVGHAKQVGDPEIIRIYHHLLQKEIIDWIGLMFRGTWSPEILVLDTPVGTGTTFGPSAKSSGESRILSTPEIENLLEGNLFAKIHNIPPAIAVPLRTTVNIKVPGSDMGPKGKGVITFRSNMCSLSIETECNQAIVGLGSFQPMLNLSYEEAYKFTTVTYLLRIKADFCRWKSGHPDMPKYRHWINQIAEILKSNFDEQVLWGKAKANYALFK